MKGWRFGRPVECYQKQILIRSDLSVSKAINYKFCTQSRKVVSDVRLAESVYGSAMQEYAVATFPSNSLYREGKFRMQRRLIHYVLADSSNPLIIIAPKLGMNFPLLLFLEN